MSHTELCGLLGPRTVGSFEEYKSIINELSKVGQYLGGKIYDDNKNQPRFSSDPLDLYESDSEEESDIIAYNSIKTGKGDEVVKQKEPNKLKQQIKEIAIDQGKKLINIITKVPTPISEAMITTIPSVITPVATMSVTTPAITPVITQVTEPAIISVITPAITQAITPIITPAITPIITPVIESPPSSAITSTITPVIETTIPVSNIESISEALITHHDEPEQIKEDSHSISGKKDIDIDDALFENALLENDVFETFDINDAIFYNYKDDHINDNRLDELKLDESEDNIS